VNPLSPLAYYRRHKGRALLLVALIALTILGVCVMVRLLDSTTEQYEATESYLTRLSLVYARADSFELGVVSRIQAFPDVARTIPAKSLWVTVPRFGALPSDYPLFGVSEADLPALMEVCDLGLKAGRLPQLRSNEQALAGEPVRAIREAGGEYVHLGGILRAFLLTADSPQVHGEVLNLAGSHMYHDPDLACLVVGATGSGSPVELVENPGLGMVSVSVDKLRRVLGYAPGWARGHCHQVVQSR
jgi:hypothetical protein